MGIKYYKLFDLLNRLGMKKSDLREILSSATIAKLSKGQNISGEAIEKICKFLKCQPADIMEYVEENIIDEEIVEEAIRVHYPTEEVIEVSIYKDGIPIGVAKDREWIKEHCTKETNE